jgi:hypothetical protein
MLILSFGWFIAGYQLDFLFGKKKGHAQIMKYVDNKLKEKLWV